MNNNRSRDYENYMKSYGIREIFREAGVARMLKGTPAMPGVEKAKQVVLRFAGAVIAFSLLMLFFG